MMTQALGMPAMICVCGSTSLGFGGHEDSSQKEKSKFTMASADRKPAVFASAEKSRQM